MAAFVAKQVVGNKLNAVKGMYICIITFKVLTLLTSFKRDFYKVIYLLLSN